MKTVFLCTTRRISQQAYHVDFIYSTLEAAQKWLEKINVMVLGRTEWLGQVEYISSREIRQGEQVYRIREIEIDV